jgi:hypothetical protein
VSVTVRTFARRSALVAVSVGFQSGYGINRIETPAGIGGDGGAGEIVYDDTAPELERKVVI